jgi:Concanavalin A-like lectin/glucanases superfamily/Secretion system C-terminal sorting domain
MIKKLPFQIAAILGLAILPFMGEAQQNALDFDNVDDQVTVANASATIANSTNISLTMWVYPANTTISFPNFDGFAGFRNNVDADFYLIHYTPTGVEARFRNSAGVLTDVIYTSLAINTWQHFVFTYNGTTLTLYRNGVSVGTAPATGTISSATQTFFMGNLPYQGTNFWLNGKLDEVSLWNKALSAQEVACIYNNHIDASDPNLKLYYKFNQGVANGNNATITTLQNTVAGYPGSLVNFAKTGTTSNFVPGIIKGTIDSASICQGQSITFGALNITTSGNYVQAFPTSSICDSIVELKVTVANLNLSVQQNATTLTSAQAGATYQWLNCGSGNSPISSATLQSYVPTATGSYSVIVTLNNCSDTSSCINFTAAGIEELNTLAASVFPNPFNTQLEIKFAKNYLTAEINITDISGKLVYNNKLNAEKTAVISTEKWQAGTYFIEIISDEGVLRKKIIKQ